MKTSENSGAEEATNHWPLLPDPFEQLLGQGRPHAVTNFETSQARPRLAKKQRSRADVCTTVKTVQHIYDNHFDCHTLICFVYDPESRITNPAGLEADFSRNDPDLTMRVIISPTA